MSLITILVLSEMILRIVPEQTSGDTWGIVNRNVTVCEFIILKCGECSNESLILNLAEEYGETLGELIKQKELSFRDCLMRKKMHSAQCVQVQTMPVRIHRY